MEKISIDIKSLEKFKETIIIHILPFRFRNNNLELLLHKANESNDYFKDFSDFRLKSDVTDIFAAARLLLQLVHNQIFILDQTRENWTDPLFQKALGVIASSFENHSFQNHKTYFIEELLWNSNYEPNSNFQWFSKEEITPTTCSSDFIEYMSKFDIKAHLKFPKKKYYAIINCESNRAWYNIYEGLYQGYLQKEHEIWLSFNINKGVVPTEDDIQKVSGWVVTGSTCATYDKTLPWLDDLFKLLNNIMKVKGKQTRIFGICFGHQALAKAFGGETEKMQNEELLIKQRIHFTENFLQKEFVKKSGVSLQMLKEEGVLLNQAHGDHISKLPPNGELYGFSNNTEVECFGIGDEILGIQPHPEFCDQIMIYKLLFHAKEDEELIKSLIKSYTELDLHNKEIMMICREFLNLT